MVKRMLAGIDAFDLIKLSNKPPHWNEGRSLCAQKELARCRFLH